MEEDEQNKEWWKYEHDWNRIKASDKEAIFLNPDLQLGMVGQENRELFLEASKQPERLK